ncbi:DUF3795 domain-containing protein [Candidatus Soleaferrea massiliensis]|uniref:DUF3795 domain-containing protein n=1 Tax=Candidatus Soleaferrea massiliensis TaxID=1470354 RepID=UPI00058C5E4B|nr:DUF3795 domain-containing protein [Candidatus Soleaferrea massiliensis]
MIESKCGILCAACAYREQMNCKGCVRIEQPFWGACPIKACCEQKEHEHCGLCADFPCKLLLQFAFDKEQGDNGARIRQCAAWLREDLKGGN